MMTRGAPSANSSSTNCRDDRRAVADADQLGPADRDVDAERAERLVLIGVVVLQMRVVALEIADRLAVQLDDQRLDRDAVDVLADLGELALGIVPPLRHMRLGEPAREHRQVRFGHRPEAVAGLSPVTAASSVSTTKLWLV